MILPMTVNSRTFTSFSLMIAIGTFSGIIRQFFWLLLFSFLIIFSDNNITVDSTCISGFFRSRDHSNTMLFNSSICGIHQIVEGACKEEARVEGYYSTWSRQTWRLSGTTYRCSYSCYGWVWLLYIYVYLLKVNSWLAIDPANRLSYLREQSDAEFERGKKIFLKAVCLRF